MVNTNFKVGFEKQAFLGALARGAGKLTAAAGKRAKATVTGAGSLADKARVHTKGVGEYLKKNYQAGKVGKPGITYKGSVANVKRSETMAARKNAVEASKAQRAAKQGPAEVSKAQTKEAPKAAPAASGSVQQLSDKVKEHVSKINPRVQGGAIGLAGGAYLGNKLSKEESSPEAGQYGVQYA